MLTNIDLALLGLAGGVVRVLVGYSKVYGPLAYPPPFLWKRAALTIFVALLTGMIAPFLTNIDNIGLAFAAGFAGSDFLEALAKGLMKVKTGFATGFTKSRYNEFGASAGEGLSKNQQRAMKYLEKNNKITNDGYQHINKVSHTTASRDLAKLMKIGLLKKTGKGKNIYYTIA